MVWPKTSIARLMLIVLFLAIDASLLRLQYRPGRILPYDPGALLLVPTIQASLILAFPRRGRVRAFWAGFLGTAAVVLLLYSGVRWPLHGLAYDWISTSYYFLKGHGVDIYRLSSDELQTILFASAHGLVMVGAPLLAVCAAGGFAARRAESARYRSRETLRA